jgi:hypothetical protein
MAAAEAPPAAPAQASASGTEAAPAPAAAAPAAAAAKGGAGSAFRETLWFKKGDVDQMVADAKAKLASAKVPDAEAVVAPPEDVRPIEDRYVDDGTVTTEDRKKFSLRTGGTGTAVPTVGKSVPGEAMTEKDVINEIAGTRKTIILVIASVVVAALVVVLMLMMRGKNPTPPKAAVPHTMETAPAPATTTAAVQAKPPAPAPAPVAKAEPRPAATREPVKKKSPRTSAPCVAHIDRLTAAG